jgi:Domain of unknown function (DUF4296)
MKKTVVLIMLFTIFLSCKEEIVKKPKNLVEKATMVNIMYDLSLFDAIKYQSPATLDSAKITSTKYIYKKYQVDSLQFAQSNKYYAADYKEYKKMYDEIDARLKQVKLDLEAKQKVENKKKTAKK